ncbi:MAG: GNAT family N-acetyltransferase [Anaerolineales bacterium]
MEPTLETARLHLRLMQASDIDQLLQIFADPKVMASFAGAPFNRDQMERWVQRNLDHQNRYGYGLFSVILKSRGIVIGDCGLEHMEIDGVQAVELGYDFRSDYWNQGYATEAASQRVAEKIGMRFNQEIKRHGVRYWKYALDRETCPQTQPT